MTIMTSRERVLRTVNFQNTDRVPIDLGAMKASGIGVKAYNRIKTRLAIHTKTRIWDPKFMIASVEEEVMRKFHLDVLPLDVSSAVHDMRPDREWIPKSLYEGAEGLLPPGTNIGTDRLSNVTMGLPSEWMIMLMTEKETCHEMMDKSVEASIKCLEQLHEAVGDYCFAWGIAADDSGTQRGEFINPELWAENIIAMLDAAYEYGWQEK